MIPFEEYIKKVNENTLPIDDLLPPPLVDDPLPEDSCSLKNTDEEESFAGRSLSSIIPFNAVDLFDCNVDMCGT